MRTYLRLAWNDLAKFPDFLLLKTNRWLRDVHSPIDVPNKPHVICRHCKTGTAWPCEHWLTADNQIGTATDVPTSWRIIHCFLVLYTVFVWVAFPTLLITSVVFGYPEMSDSIAVGAVAVLATALAVLTRHDVKAEVTA